MVVNDLVVVELKAINRFAPIHTAQMQTCLKLTGYPSACSSTSTCRF